MKKFQPFLILDAFRGVAALWVILLHACLPFITTQGNIKYISSPFYIISLWGQLGVVLFFVISGYCITNVAYSGLISNKSILSYLAARAWRIYPTYWAAALIAIALSIFIYTLQHNHLFKTTNSLLIEKSDFSDPTYWISNISLTEFELGKPQFLFVAWSLCYEVCFYAIIAGLLLLSRMSDSSVMLSSFRCGIIALTAISLGWLIFSPDTCHFPMDRWYQFGLGALLFLAITEEKDRIYLKICLITAAINTLLFAILSTAPGLRLSSTFSVSSPSHQAVTATAFVLLLWIIRPFDSILAQRFEIRPLMWLGSISYSAYLIHLIPIAFINSSFRRIGFDHDLYWINFLTQIFTSIFTGWIFYLAVERHFISSRRKNQILKTSQ